MMKALLLFLILSLSLWSQAAGPTLAMAFWRSNKATQLTFTVSNPTLNTWSCSLMTVKRADQANRSAKVGALVVSLTGADVSYYSDSDCGMPITDITIPDGSATANFYYGFRTAGSLTINASAGAITAATQTTTVSLDPYTWDGGGADANWNTAANWVGNAVPGSTNTAHFDTNCVSNCSATLNVDPNVRGVYIHTGYVGTVSQASGVAVTLSNSTSSNFVQEAGTFTGNDADIAIVGSFYLNGGSFTATSTTISASSDWIVNGSPTFDSTATGTVAFINSNVSTFSPGSTEFRNMTWAKSSNTQTLNGTMTVNGNISWIPSGTASLSGGTIVVKGDLYLNSTGSGSGSVLIKMAGLALQTATGVSAASGLPNFEVDSLGGLQLVGDIRFSRDFTHTSGVITPGTSLVKFASTSTATGTFNSTTFNDVSFQKSVNFAMTGTMLVGGNYTHIPSSSAVMTGGSIDVAGNITYGGSVSQSSSTTMRLVGTNPQSLSGVVGSSGTHEMEFASSNTVTLSGTLNVARGWNYTSGTISAATSHLIFVNTSSVAIDPGPFEYYDVTMQKSSGSTSTLSGSWIITHDFTFNPLSSTAIMNGGTVEIRRNLIAGGAASMDAEGTTVFKMNGTVPQSIVSSSGSSNILNLNLDSAGGVTFGSVVSNAGHFTYTSGTVSAGSSLFRLRGDDSATIDPGNIVFYDVAILRNSGTTATISGTMNVTNDLDLSLGASTTTFTGGTIEIGGDLELISNGGVGNNGTTLYKMVGTTAQTISGNTNSTRMGSLEIASPGGVSVLGQIRLNGNLTHTSGAFNAGTSTVTLEAATVTASAISFHNVTILGSTAATISGNLNVDGNLVVNKTTASGRINTGTINLKGDLTMTALAGGGTAGINFVGSGAQTITRAAGVVPSGAIAVAKPGGTLTLASSFPLTSAGQGFSITSGTMNLSTFTLTVPGSMSVTGGTSSLQCAGGCGAGTACGQGLGRLVCGSLSVTGGGSVVP
jgi:hypothetical protein